jgi:hypothetical protein
MEFNHSALMMRLRLGRAWSSIYVPCVSVVLVAQEGLQTLQNENVRLVPICAYISPLSCSIPLLKSP